MRSHARRVFKFVLLISAPFWLCRKGGKALLGEKPVQRICHSFFEFIMLFAYGLCAENGAREEFLMDDRHGSVVLVCSLVCFVIYTQYQLLFPQFALPLFVRSRSKYGYAYAGDIEELRRMRLPTFPLTRKVGFSRNENEFVVNNAAEFWDERRGLCEKERRKCITAALFALANGHLIVVEWLEARGAASHQGLSQQGAALILSEDKYGFALRNRMGPLRRLRHENDADFWNETVEGYAAMLAKWAMRREPIEPATEEAFDYIEEQLPQEVRLRDGESLDAAMRTVEEYMCKRNVNRNVSANANVASANASDAEREVVGDWVEDVELDGASELSEMLNAQHSAQLVRRGRRANSE